MAQYDGPTKEFYIARITRSHGVRGGFKVELLSGEPERFDSLKTFWAVHPENSDERIKMTMRPAEVKSHALILAADPWTTPEEVTAHRGWYIVIARGDALPLKEDEYYVADLIGLPAKTTDGKDLGVVIDALQDRAQALLEIHEEGKANIMVPAVPEIIRRVDFATPELILDMPKGLVEMYRPKEGKE